jgi:hypothetical protein
MLISHLRCCGKIVDARRKAQRMVAPFASLATPQTLPSRNNPSGRGRFGRPPLSHAAYSGWHYCASCFADGIPIRPRRWREINVNTS